jgi:hypothetical protein
MNEHHILDHFNGKLYNKDTIKRWDLPPQLEEQLALDTYEYFFLTSSAEQEKHGKEHLHFSVFPTKYDLVYLLEVETSTIIPQLLHDTLALIKEGGKDIITSTGFCTRENICYFGIFFSTETVDPLDSLIEQIKKLENVRDAAVFQYSCKGCRPVE